MRTYKVWIHVEEYDEVTGESNEFSGLPIGPWTFPKEDDAVSFAHELEGYAHSQATDFLSEE